MKKHTLTAITLITFLTCNLFYGALRAQISGPPPPPPCISWSYYPLLFVNGVNVDPVWTPGDGQTPYSGSNNGCCSACSGVPMVVCAGAPVEFVNNSIGGYIGPITNVIIDPSGTVIAIPALDFAGQPSYTF
ncbi:MAG TPA: hypothetical protein VK890_03270, partial [Bacteroidia bacterium]|nr:hypothetical protein [Bacteroidia bacterium]